MSFYIEVGVPRTPGAVMLRETSKIKSLITEFFKCNIVTGR